MWSPGHRHQSKESFDSGERAPCIIIYLLATQFIIYTSQTLFVGKMVVCCVDPLAVLHSVDLRDELSSLLLCRRRIFPIVILSQPLVRSVSSSFFISLFLNKPELSPKD
jgi:hypothetical protein